MPYIRNSSFGGLVGWWEKRKKNLSCRLWTTRQCGRGALGSTLCLLIYRWGREHRLLLAACRLEALCVLKSIAHLARAAQYRAVENDIPVVRAALLGPSAIINADGSIAAWMPEGESGVLRGAVQVGPAHQTLYTRFGNLPLTLFIAGILILAWRARLLSKFPGR